MLFIAKVMRFQLKNFKTVLTASVPALVLIFCFVGSATAFESAAGNDITLVPDDGSEVRIMLLGEKSTAKYKKGKYIDISLSRQTMTLYQDGKSAGSYLISSGKRSMATPKGTFKVYNKARRAWSEEYGLYMPYWMAFTPSGSHGIHELPEWPNGYKEGASHLGTPVSHGCVRLGVGAAKRVYEWAPIGTPVGIH